jgi:hypothetical protein
MSNEFPKHINHVPDKIEENTRNGIKTIKRKAKAPYNFVELPDKIVEAEPLPDADRYQDHKEDQSQPNKIKRYTGRIKCNLSPESQIYIRCGWNPEDFAKYSESSFNGLSEIQKQKRANFFHNPTDLSPVIPGSSLRGMIRSLIEIISCGKIKLVSNQRLAFRAVADSQTSLGKEYRKYFANQPQDNPDYAINAGYIIQQNSNWKIRPANPINQLPFDREKKDLDIVLNLERWYGLNNVYKMKHINAVFIKTGDIPKKEKNFVFGLPVNIDSSDVLIPKKMLQEYEEQITEGQKSLTGQNGVLENMRPVFYLLNKDNELVFLGHTMMFRLPYDLSPFEFIAEWLRDESKTDIAEAIFGYVEDKHPREKARAGRVFFTDATTKSVVEYPATKSILLSSPKPTTFQHYLVQDNVNPKNLKHYASNPPAKEKAGDTTIRGHKLYWHKEQVVDQSQDANSDTQTSLIKPINPNPATTFTFDIHFENLSRVELGTLLWVLSIGGDKAKEFGIGKTGEDYRLSLGMGKPLGMGAVKIDPTLYISDRQSRYSSLFNTHNNQWTVSESEASISEYLQAFEKYVLNEKTGIAETDHPQGRMAENLKEIPRIEMLLAMLRWDSMPNAEQTRYMTITAKEYQNRPVLPTPLQVVEIADNRRFASKSNSTPKPVPKSNSLDIREKPKIQQGEKPIQRENKTSGRKPPSSNSGNVAMARPPKPPKKS